VGVSIQYRVRSILNDTVLDQESEQNPYGTLPRILADFCSMTVETLDHHADLIYSLELLVS